MSSFVIRKIEYIKAAGLMYGIEETTRYPHSWFLRNVYNKFVECYEMNEKSVNEQYGHESGMDSVEYKETFEQYRIIGRKISYGGKRDELKERMKQFFDSSLYQIENEDMHDKCCAWYWMCLDKFDKFKEETRTSWENMCWGEINLANL